MFNLTMHQWNGLRDFDRKDVENEKYRKHKNIQLLKHLTISQHQSDKK